MDSFWVVTLFHLQPAPEEWQALESLAVEDFNTLGIEEFSLEESEVDALLGERSYSGGDLPESVLDEVETIVLGKPATYRFFFGDKQDAESFTERCSTLLLAEIQLEEHASQDWNAEWKKHYNPIKVNEMFEIIPSWMAEYQSHSKESIRIYPGMGFGTGSHETTFLCLKLFTEEILMNSVNTVLDFGSGSGILGLSALKFFPDAKVDFYDIDIEANKNCYQNAELNQLQEKSFRLLLPEVREKLLPSYDLVFANILESILMQEKDSLIQATNKSGTLILSGLLRHQVSGIVESYTDSGMKLVRKLEKGDWAALMMQKA